MPPKETWALALLACGDVSIPQPPPSDPVSEDEGWAYVRSATTRPRTCFRGWKEYCPVAPERVDALIQHQLDRHFDGRMPERRRDLEELTQESVTSWMRFQRSPEGRALVRERIEALYEDPPAEIVGGHGVSLRVGVPPGKVVVSGDRFDAPMTVRSPHVVDGEWATPELARHLARAMQTWPDQPAYRLVVWIPRGGEGAMRRMDIRYYRDLDRIVLADGATDGAWVSPELGGDPAPYLEGRLSLHTRGLQRCAVDDAGRPRCR